MSKPTTDHLGNRYASVKELMEAYGIHRDTYHNRIRRGLSVEEALTMPDPRSCRDHTGKEYPSVQAMAEAYNLSRQVLDARLKRGWNLKKALTSSLYRRGQETLTDHLGKEYLTLTALAKAYGISRVTLKARLAAGMDMEKALTTPVRKNYTQEKNNNG